MRPFLSTLIVCTGMLLVSADTQAQQFRIDVKPTATIGADGDEKSILHSVLGAWRLSNGEIAVVEIGGQTPIRVFKADGTFARIVARSGMGPGEIGPTLYSASRVGDSIVTFEFAGADGELCIEKFWLDEVAPREFAVVDRAGRVIGRVTDAPAVHFTDFGRDYAVGIAMNDDGVQTVVVHTLAR